MSLTHSEQSSNTLPRILPPQPLLDKRPWGWFKQYTLNQETSARIVTILDGREVAFPATDASKMWIILDDAISITIDGVQKTVKRDEELFIPQGAHHKARGLSQPCRLLEISFGATANTESYPMTFPPKRKTVHTDWGGYDIITEQAKTTLKIITVQPHQKLSLQWHEHRSEWWIILDEAMDVIMNDKQLTLHRGEDVYLPQGTVHRMIGRDAACRLVETAFGTFDEQDNHRLADEYGRADAAVLPR